jgi:hypothetical protein
MDGGRRYSRLVAISEWIFSSFHHSIQMWYQFNITSSFIDISVQSPFAHALRTYKICLHKNEEHAGGEVKVLNDKRFLAEDGWLWNESVMASIL